MRLIALLLITLVAPAIAQKQDAFDLYVANVALLTLEPVRTELKITEQQRSRMNVHATKFNKTMENLRAEAAKLDRTKPIPASFAERQAVALKNMSDAVLGILSPEQLRRLRELSLQHSGLPVLGDERVASRLKLTNRQRDQIRSVYEKALSESAKVEEAAFGPIEREFAAKKPQNEAEARRLSNERIKRLDAKLDEIRPRIHRLRDQADARVTALLSASQRQAWRNLLGREFRLPENAPAPKR
jgi:hypothetical protein